MDGNDGRGQDTSGRKGAEREGLGTRSRGSEDAPSSYPTEGDEQVCVPLTVAQ